MSATKAVPVALCADAYPILTRATSASGRPPSRSEDCTWGSREELTPGGGDRLAGVPVALTALATLIRPAAWRYLAGGSTGAYSLTAAAWEDLRRAAAPVGPRLPGD